MPPTSPRLSRDQAVARLHEQSLPDDAGDLVGVELEWILRSSCFVEPDGRLKLLKPRWPLGSTPSRLPSTSRSPLRATARPPRLPTKGQTWLIFLP